MNLNDKKVQFSILAVLAGCAVLFMVLQFLIMPALSSLKEDSAKTVEIRKNLSEMREIVQSRPAVQDQIAAAKAAIKGSAAHMPLPVLGNYFLGMEGYLRGCASNHQVTLVSIADGDVIEIMPDYCPIKIYRVRVQSKSDYDSFVRLASDMCSNNPLLSISGLNIVARNDSPSSHDMNFVVSWLVWSDPAKRPAFLIEGQ